ncbi:alpha/beta hydrolase family protein [Paraperlucidibaca wandonensis]|uniref:Alpha/beta hydrolase family protein n=1 Tax=Paraperlucidibaca wandonensis TaxID=1268273 RepID=A0ABW3HC36_9GAMM
MPEPEKAQAFDPAVELSNGMRQLQRQDEYLTPDYQLRLYQESMGQLLESLAILGGDPERQFLTDLCWSNGLPCAGDVRLYDWQKSGYGIVEPVLFANRTGAIISGHVWATKQGPAKRPLIVITGGSIQATEQMYWWAAQTLAKAGYVVLTTDPQNQGRSDTFGEGADAGEGVPPQFSGNTFYDGTVDALDFMLSTPEKPFCPVLARSGNSHCEKQSRRAKAGLNTAFNPYWQLVDTQRIGLAGHSYGAAGVSYVGQQDARVKAIVAWDNLCNPLGAPSPCQAGFQAPTPVLHVPALGISNDYAGGPIPQPNAKSQASFELSKAGVETGMIVIRGGTHFEYSYLPLSAFSATHRGIDLAAWYTTAWFDKFLKSDPSAESRLLTSRWRQDATDATLDPAGKGNMFSSSTRSRLDLRLKNGARWICEDLRQGCVGLVDADGVSGDYSFLDISTRPESTPQ